MVRGVKSALLTVGIMAVLLLLAAFVLGRGSAAHTYTIYTGSATSSATSTKSGGGTGVEYSTSGVHHSSSSFVDELVSNSTVGKAATFFNKALDWFKGYVTFVVSGSRLDIIVKAAFISVVLFALSYMVSAVRVLMQGIAVFTVLLAIAALLGVI